MKIAMVTHLYKYKAFSLLRMFLYIVGYIVIYSLPVDFMNDVSLCIIYHLFHVKCLMCGMSRGLWHMVHFDVSGAYAFHPLSFYVYILIMILVFLDIYVIVKTFIKDRKEGKYGNSR